ncbi:MAG: ParB/RepB/Spo0J family partition protein [Fusobacteria bacterium]|nr:ParB/RepB/Spo0J family partition protein [Fusobacteriota bacterium]
MKLGKGLGALIKEKEYILELELNKIIANPFQPRKEFDENKIRELAESIKENGIIQPIIVRKIGENYEIIAGERRYRAAIEAKFEKIPVIVRKAAEDKSLELAVIENIQRENLNAIEEGEAYELLIKKYSYTQEKLAKKLGKNRSTITNKLRILKLPDEIKEVIKKGELSAGHARTVLSLEDTNEQVDLVKKIISGNLSVRKTEDLVKNKKNECGGFNKKNRRVEIIEVENKLRDYFGAKVKIKEGKDKKGKLEIEFCSDGDLERIIESMGIK